MTFSSAVVAETTTNPLTVAAATRGGEDTGSVSNRSTTPRVNQWRDSNRSGHRRSGKSEQRWWSSNTWRRGPLHDGWRGPSDRRGSAKGRAETTTPDAQNNSDESVADKIRTKSKINISTYLQRVPPPVLLFLRTIKWKHVKDVFCFLFLKTKLCFLFFKTIKKNLPFKQVFLFFYF